ncbi:Dihydroorotase [Sinobacterium norvegicum]|uniref:Dihydroorotase n=1 Tax=Sinobacterium norvegicum TaxID=1641715 RepID=A0ABN8EKK4_9GAMM|nr:dihydroorotase [Sinobacterium norvegicum]CAH0991695.1 Dihydroorotase [Sinobacterium norvegicum]
MTELIITRPDDWHLHLRDDQSLSTTVADTARIFARAIVMPNLSPPITTMQMAVDYKSRIDAHSPGRFQPLMAIYLTDITSPEVIIEAKNSGIVFGAKLYPAGATTGSASGVTAIEKIFPALAAMEECGLPLLIHGEVTHDEVDIFDREKRFLDTHLLTITNKFPALRMVVEHITTKDAADFVIASGDNVAATITPQHLLYNRNHMLVGGIKPHFYCLPILKRNTHQTALIEAAISGNTSFFLGTDSAPHTTANKENSCGCAGCYSAFAGLELYAEAFDAAGAIDKLEGFASHHGPDFYRLPRNTDKVKLIKSSWTVANQLPLGNELLTPLKAGEEIQWQAELLD